MTSFLSSLPNGARLQIIEDEHGNRTVLTPRTKFVGADAPPSPVPTLGETRWYVPYTAVHPLTVAGAPRDAVWVNVAHSDASYYAALLDIWAQGETFALLEHDVVCRPDVVQAFEECPEPWCAYGYGDICHWSCMDAWRNVLGCTRFRRELVQAVPDALSRVPDDRWDWHTVCDRLGDSLREAGFTHHWHWPPVEHHHLTADRVPQPLMDEWNANRTIEGAPRT
jgi:hypothetical protein